MGEWTGYVWFRIHWWTTAVNFRGPYITPSFLTRLATISLWRTLLCSNSIISIVRNCGTCLSWCYWSVGLEYLINTVSLWCYLRKSSNCIALHWLYQCLIMFLSVSGKCWSHLRPLFPYASSSIREFQEIVLIHVCTSIHKVPVPILIQIILDCIKIRSTVRVSAELNACIKQYSIPHDRRLNYFCAEQYVPPLLFWIAQSVYWRAGRSVSVPGRS
jgi:hypothetical protein